MLGMAKWLCACGSQIQSSGPIPNPTEWLLVSDSDFDTFAGTVDAEKVYAAMSHAFRCPACGRLHIFWRGFDNEPTIYRAEP
jgi:hypothetical protein